MTMPSLFLSHGAPTLPLTDTPARAFLQQLGHTLERPNATLVISAHWETAVPMVNAVDSNETIHDFGGFPRALYDLRYPAPGSPTLAAHVAASHAMERDATTFIQQSGGKVLGSVSPPQGTTDYSSFVLQAQASKAKIVGLATASSDTINTVKQAGEFGLTSKGQKLGGLLVFINDIDALGLQAAQGLILTTSFYWDMNDETRAWTKRFWQKVGDKKPPNMDQAGLYAAVFHYLQAVQAAGTDEAKAVAKKMRELRVNDFYNKNVEVRADGRVMHKMYLMEVKSPAESKYKFDYYKLIKDIAPADAFRPLSEGGCPLLAKK